MTDTPDSKVFYLNNYSGKRFAGASLARVKVKGEKISVHVKELTASQKTGNLYEHLRNIITYSAHINEHGVKYLKVESKTGHGSTKDASLELAAFGDVLYFDQFLSASSSLEKFLEEAISAWFNIPCIPKEGHGLLFPLLAVEEEPIPLLKELREVDDLSCHNGRVAQILRTSVDVSSALKKICGETVQSEVDVVAILRNPVLLQFAEMKLGMTISEFVSVTPVLSPMKTGHTRVALKFMLTHLPDEKRNTIVSIIQDTSKSAILAHELSATKGLQPYWRAAGLVVRDYCYLVELSQSQRKALSEELFQYFTLPVQEVVGRYAPGNALRKRFHLWVAENILRVEAVSEATVKDVEAVFHELLMPDCTHRIDVDCEHGRAVEGIRYKPDEWGNTFCTVSKLYALTFPQEDLNTDLAANLALLAGKTGRFIHTPFGGLPYVDDRGQLCIADGDFYPLHKAIPLIRRGVEETDKRLTKLGRSATPENRVAYLKFGSKERKFKNTWRYYDLGVTETSKILALKKAKITSKRDIKMYAALPDEMFYEIIGLRN